MITILSIGLCQIVSGQSKYIREHKPLADSLADVYDVPSAIILGVAILESSSGKSQSCRLLHNHFGIVGKNILFKTKKLKSRYKQYPNTEASYIDFCRLLTKRKFYKTLKGKLNNALWADAISKSAYSEVPETWKHRLLHLIRKNKLSNKH